MMKLYVTAAALFWNAYVSPIGITTDAFVSPISSKAVVITSSNHNQNGNGNQRHPTFMVQQSSSTGSNPRSNTNGQRNNNNNNKNNNNYNGKNKRTNNNSNNYNNNKRPNKNFPSGNSKQLMQAKAINKQLIESESAKEVLDIFISKGGAKGRAGGDVFNSVNFSTFMHRLARFATFVDYKNKKDLSADEKRKIILSDPRTAILIASLSEAIVQPTSNKMLVFNNRELANLGWAVSKLKLAPPSNIYPIVRTEEAKICSSRQDKDLISYSTQKEMDNDILQTAFKVRQQVLEVAKERHTQQQMGGAVTAVQNRWIPTMSQLSGKLLDNIAAQVLDILNKFNSQELANLLYAFASAGRADVYFFDQLADQLVKNVEQNKHSGGRKQNGYQYSQPKPQEFSNSIWAFASAGIRCDGQRRLIQCVADTLDQDNGKILREFKPQELSNTAWGIATLISRRSSENSGQDNSDEDQAALRILRWVAKSLTERVDYFKPQEISNTIWAFATLGFGATTSTGQFNTNNEYISLPSDQIDMDRKLVAETLLVVARNASTRLQRFRPQELNNLAWGFCRLGQYSDEMRHLFEGVGKEILRRHRYFAPQDIGTTLWSFATVEYFDEAVFKAAASELTLNKSHSFKPQELSNTVWALATAGAVPQYPRAFDTTTVKSSQRVSLRELTSDPITACFAAATKELIRRPQEFKEQEIKDVLWSLSKSGIRHPAVFKKVAEHLVGATEGDKCRGLGSFSPQGLGNLAWSYAKQAQLAEGGSESLIGTTGRLAVYEASSMDVGEDLIRRLFSAIGKTAMNSSRDLCRFKPQDLSNTCWAFATLGLLHNEFFRAVGDQVEQRLANFKPGPSFDNALTKFKAQEIANLVWSFATLNCQHTNIMESFAPYMVYICSNSRSNKKYDEKSIARCLKRQEAANIAWSCTVLEQYPKQLLPLLYVALFGDAGSSPASLEAIYGDDGIQRQAIMTMFYVQMALDIEAPELGLSLPPKFPVDWKESQNEFNNVYIDGTDTSLQLTTSRLQGKVSSALERIGFDHVQEHVISTSELENDLGIVLSHEDQEFLSIDIADVENLIGLEVDGPGHFITVLDDADDTAITMGDKSNGEILRKSDGKNGWKFMANAKQKNNGPTTLKDRLLQHLGWSVMHIPYWEWRDLKANSNAEEEYIQNLLKDIK